MNRIVPASGAVITREDKDAIINVVERGWFTERTEAKEFSDALRSYIGTRHATLCNSGSSANLLALSALADKESRSYAVITCATGFPTTVSPIYQNELVPLFVDADPRTLNADEDQVLELLQKDDVCGVILAHMLGFPYDAETIRKECDRLDKFLIEDCCDALGAKIRWERVGSFGHASTFSFFPAHHITTGEGGAVLTDDGRLLKLINSYRDWGRDCYCAPGQNATCNNRFGHEFPDLPEGWDHKYTFTKIGYNLKMTEMQAALGLSQLLRIENFIVKRLANSADLYYFLEDYQDHLGLYLFNTKYIPSPFGFPIAVISKEFTIQEIISFLEENGIRTRRMFGGNLTRHPAFSDTYYEAVGELPGSNFIMENVFWVGIWHGLSSGDIQYIGEKFHEFFKMKELI